MSTNDLTLLSAISDTRLVPGQDINTLRMLDEALDLGVAILDEDLRYQYLGKGMFKQLGLPEGSLKVGDTLQDCHNLMIEHGLITQKKLEKGHLTAAETRTVTSTRDRSDISKLGNGMLVQLQRKELPTGHIVSMAYDATSLIEKDELLEQALVLGRAGYWTFDFKTKAYLLSDTLKTYFGDSDLETIAKKGILHTVHPDDRHVFREALRNITKTGDMFQHTCRTNTYKGNERWSQTTAQVIRDEKGRPVKMRAFVKDVTRARRKAAELEKAKDEAIAASHAKSEFLANMSHEIRTPMNGILGMAELLANTEVDQRQSEFIKVINNSASALLNIINDILDFSKIEAGRFELDPVPFTLTESLSDVVTMLLPKAQEKGLEVVINYPPDLPRHFIGDALRLRQIITNLVGNAIKFTENGHILVDIAVQSHGKDNALLAVAVKDTGIGIEPQNLQTVFDKFTQADGSTTRTYGGTGLGLSICKKIIEMMGGRLKAESVFGEGSTFAFSIPIKRDLDAARKIYDTVALAGKHVLIVDDIEVNRQLLSQQVQRWDMIPTTVRDGVEALIAMRDAAASGTPFDLVLLDYLMPGMNGREVAKVITSTDGLNQPPVIILSSCDQDFSTAEMNAIGVRSYQVKPVRERVLYRTISTVMSTPPEAYPDMPKMDAAPVPAPKDTRKRAELTASPARIADIPTPQAPLPSVDVLVAEDFALNRDVVRLMLADTSFNPVFAENGQIAVDMFTQSPDRFPLILMDVSMPIMDGYDATGLINAFNEAQGRPHTPIIALTGHALKHDREKCLDAGMDDYLSKPVQQSCLIEKLEEFYAQVMARETPQAASA